MKKTYIKPSVECFNVNAQSIIAASPNPLSLREGAGNEITNENVNATKSNDQNFTVKPK